MKKILTIALLLVCQCFAVGDCWLDTKQAACDIFVHHYSNAGFDACVSGAYDENKDLYDFHMKAYNMCMKPFLDSIAHYEDSIATVKEHIQDSIAEAEYKKLHAEDGEYKIYTTDFFGLKVIVYKRVFGNKFSYHSEIDIDIGKAKYIQETGINYDEGIKEVYRNGIQVALIENGKAYCTDGLGKKTKNVLNVNICR